MADNATCWKLSCRLLIVMLHMHSSSILGHAQSVVVNTRTGALRGIRDVTENGRPIYSFLGVPYAKPPVGELRFKEPARIEKWDGIKDATNYGAHCPQVDRSQNIVTGNEDCLFLNVHTPQLPSQYPSSFAVMVFIHGGNFLRGSGDIYKPAKFLHKPVVLVTVNYRLGTLGFLSTANHDSPGNYGLLDVVAALHWVQENIVSFGGDPQRVTIFGQGSGSAMVSHIILSPLTAGLFWASILQSGTSLCDWAVEEDPYSYAVEYASSLECDTSNSATIMSCLRGKSAEVLVFAQHSRVTWADFPLRLTAVVDNSSRVAPFLTDLPQQLLEAGRFHRMPVISGILPNDGLTTYLQLYLQEIEQITRDENYIENTLFPQFIEAITDNAYPPYKINQLKNFYFKNVDFQNPNEVTAPFAQVITDIMFASCNDEMVRALARFVPVYMYVFSFRGKNYFNAPLLQEAQNLGLNSPILSTGISNGDELIYLFNIPNINTNTLVEDRRISDILVHLWTRFAHSRFSTDEGQISQNSLPFWGRLTETNLIYYNISLRPEVGKDYRQYELAVLGYIDRLESAEPLQDPREPYFTLTWVLVGIGAVLFIAVIVLIILLVLKTKRRSFSTNHVGH